MWYEGNLYLLFMIENKRLISNFYGKFWLFHAILLTYICFQTCKCYSAFCAQNVSLFYFIKATRLITTKTIPAIHTIFRSFGLLCAHSCYVGPHFRNLWIFSHAIDINFINSWLNDKNDSPWLSFDNDFKKRN